MERRLANALCPDCHTPVVKMEVPNKTAALIADRDGEGNFAGEYSTYECGLLICPQCQYILVLVFDKE